MRPYIRFCRGTTGWSTLTLLAAKRCVTLPVAFTQRAPLLPDTCDAFDLIVLNFPLTTTRMKFPIQGSVVMAKCVEALSQFLNLDRAQLYRLVTA